MRISRSKSHRAVWIAALTCLCLALVRCGGSDDSAITNGTDAGDSSMLVGDASNDGDAATDSALGDSAAPSDGGGHGSGKTTYTCPAGGIGVMSGDDIVTAVNNAPANATICVHGPHIASQTLVPKDGQTIVGVDISAEISGAVSMSSWTADGGAWVNGGTLPATANISKTLSPGHDSCYDVATYQDDVFYSDQRMMRVMSVAQVTGADATLPAGQAVTPAEVGRFFTDYATRQIYVSLDPSSAKVELASLDELVSSKAQNVTLENLLLEKALTAVVDVGKSWTVTDCTIRFAHNFGVKVGGGSLTKYALYENDLITSNGQYGMSGSGEFVHVDNTEMSWNNIANYRTASTSGPGCDGYWAAGANKFADGNQGSAASPSLIVTGLDSHDNIGDGFWIDVYNQFVHVSGSHLHDNESFGAKSEISCNLEVDHNEIDHNGRHIKNTDLPSGGVLLNDTNDSLVHDNVIHDNVGGGVFLDFQGRGLLCAGASTSGDGGPALLHDTVYSNAIYMCSGTTGGHYSAMAPRDNLYAGNAYHATAVDSWRNGGSPIDWPTWKSGGEDLDGSVVTSSCTYP